MNTENEYNRVRTNVFSYSDNSSIITSPSFLFSELEFWPDSYSVSGFFMREISGFWAPHLLCSAEHSSCFTIPLLGDLFLSFGSKFCLECGKLIDCSNSRSLCNSCFDTPEHLFFQCLFDGPGSPFGLHTCDPNNPLCHNVYNANRCHSPYNLYIGRFGSFFKVGITSSLRRGRGHIRLVEQGLNEAWFVESFPNLEKVLEVEKYLSSFPMITDRLPLQVKYKEFISSSNTSLSDFFSKETLDWFFPGKKITYHDLFPDEKIIDSSLTLDRCPDKIEGTIILSQGSLIIWKTLDGHFFLTDSRNLVGRQVISSYLSEDYFSPKW
jgi:hypothetical protein